MPPSLPQSAFRRWTWSWRIRNPFFRSVGFELPFIFGSSSDDGEKPKVIVRTSRRLALARCGIHILPILVSMTVLILNLGNSYLGRGLPGSIIDPSINIALLQIAAKIQELLIVASTTTIVMHVLRAELISGQGLPLGLVGGGFLYTGFSYFWSPEVWGSFYTPWSAKARFRVYGIVLIGGLIAALAGPSTAVLLIPRDQPWPAGGTTIYIPGPSTDWWPTYISRNNSIQSNLDRQQGLRVDVSLTPDTSSTIWSASSSIDILGQKAYLEGSPQNLTSGFSFGPSTVDVPSELDSIRSFRYHGSHRGYACETTTWGPRAANAILQAQLKQDWTDEAFAIPYQFWKYGPSLSEYKYFGSMEVSTKTQLPVTRVACLPAGVVPYSEAKISFPQLSGSTCWTNNNISLVDVTSLNITTTQQVRITWLPLPETVGFVSGGVILELPSTLNESSRGVVACSLDSRWADGSIITYHLEDASSLEKTSRSIVVSTALLDNQVPASGWSPEYSDFQPVVTSQSSQRIILGDSWLNTLAKNASLKSPQQDNEDQVNFENILTSLAYVTGNSMSAQAQVDVWNTPAIGRVNRTVALEWWLSLLITDGLSRFGSPAVLNMTGPRADWTLLNYFKASDFRVKLFSGQRALLSPNFTHTIEENVVITIGGYSYKAGSITDYASAALLLTHMLMALVHTVYTVWWTSRSSSSWDSLTELMVLMQNSRPSSRALSNTGAGITELRTYAKKARIAAVRPHGDRPGENLVELIFDEDQLEGAVSTQSLDQMDIRPGHLVRSRRLESLSSFTSRSPLLGEDTEFVDLQTNGTASRGAVEDGNGSLRRQALEKVMPDVEYR